MRIWGMAAMAAAVLAGCGLTEGGFVQAPVQVMDNETPKGTIMMAQVKQVLEDRNELDLVDWEGFRPMRVKLMSSGSVMLRDRRALIRWTLADLRPGMTVKVWLTGKSFESIPTKWEASMIEVQDDLETQTDR